VPLRPATAAAPLLLALAALVATAGPAEARKRRAIGCDVDTRPVAFGNVDLSRNSTGTGRVTIDCASAGQVRVEIAAASGAARRMEDPKAAKLAYELYQDSGRNVRWGSGSGDGSAQPATVKADVPTSLTVYGVVPKQSGVPPGEYTDQLVVTLSF
jgi:spore coat protein U-like protein